MDVKYWILQAVSDFLFATEYFRNPKAYQLQATASKMSLRSKKSVYRFSKSFVSLLFLLLFKSYTP
jgi:hypothetical protein